MFEWLEFFFKETEATLFINGKSYKPNDWKKVAQGAEKRVFKIKNDNFCFFIPNKWHSETDWNWKIKAEKEYLDKMTKLGLKTQQFEVVPITICVPGKQSCTINVLLTKDFESLCKDESIVIFDPKRYNRVTGNAPDFMAMRERFKEKKFVQEMFRKLMFEYATAYTFSLPVSAIQINDDSEHLCFELSDNPQRPPLARYMFWDVVKDLQERAFMPLVPSMSEFKKGPDKAGGRSINGALIRISEMLASAIAEIVDKSSLLEGELFKFAKELADDILSAIDDDTFLLPALEFARTQAKKSLDTIFEELKDEHKTNNKFVEYLMMAISTGDLGLVLRSFEMRPEESLDEKSIDEVIRHATKYNYPDIVQFIESTLGIKKVPTTKGRQEAENEQAHESEIKHLKSRFIKEYNKQLQKDKNTWCGLYSFFARSYVDQNADLSELVNHARGLTNNGTGKRSQKVMKKLGWLDEHNQIKSNLSPFIENN